jgi:hypothetical protein
MILCQGSNIPRTKKGSAVIAEEGHSLAKPLIDLLSPDLLHPLLLLFPQLQVCEHTVAPASRCGLPGKLNCTHNHIPFATAPTER